MRKQMSESLNSKDFDDGEKIGSEKALRRWRSACNGLKKRRRSCHKLTDLDEHLKLQEQAVLHLTEILSLHSNEDEQSSKYVVTEADAESRRFEEPIDGVGSTVSGLDERVRVFSVVLKAVLHFTENLGGHSNEDVPSGEYIVTEADTEARRFQEPVGDIGSTVSGLDERVRVLSVVLKAVLHFTENLSGHSNEHVPSGDYIVTQAATEARRFQEPVGDVGSTVNGLDVCKLFGKYEKRTLAVFYLVLEAASFLLDVFGKRNKSILLAALLLSAFGFAITMSMHTCIMRRIRAPTRMHFQKLLLMVLEISFSVVQLIVTLIYFILAELGVKNSFNASVFPLVFAIIAAVFTCKYDGGVSDSSDLASSLMASAADLQLQNIQVHLPNNTRNEDA